VSKGSAQEGKSAMNELCFFYLMLLPENISSSFVVLLLLWAQSAETFVNFSPVRVH